MRRIINLLLTLFFIAVVTSVYAQNKSTAKSLSMSGWDLESEPKIDNSANEVGKIVYEVQIDNEGELLSIKVLEKTISPTLAKKCEEEVRKMVFIKEVNNTSKAATIKGTITFIFRVH